MKTTLLTICLSILFCLPLVNAQTYFHQTAKGKPDHRIQQGGKVGGDTLIILYDTIVVDYYSADEAKFIGNYQYSQAQLLNTYYSFPKDTLNSYKASSMMFMNYDCINSITVAFDSLSSATPRGDTTINPDLLVNFGIAYINVPIIQKNVSTKRDTLEIQLNSVDAYGYPTPNILADTMFIDSIIGYNNNYEIKNLRWYVGNLTLSTYRFAVTVNYRDSSKRDSCWFIYGYHSFTNDTCPNLPAGTSYLALPTDFSGIPYPSKRLVANSFEVWNQYTAYGMFPTEGGNNVFFPCDTNEVTFHPGVDGANYFQDIDIYTVDTVVAYLGIKNINSPFSIISQNYPNPFNDKSTITYTINKLADVNFNVSDLTGRVILTENYTKMSPGLHSIIINANTLSPGVYFYTFSSSGSTVTKKMVVY